MSQPRPMPATLSLNLAAVLAPRSIAVIGASRTTGSMGHQVLTNLLVQGFTGVVYPINPHAHAIGAVRAYASIAQVPDTVDMAVIVVPRERVLAVADECGAAGVKALVVISAGFREVGADGAVLETALMAIVRRHGMRMVGPNCMGVINASPEVSMNATFAPIMPPFGHAAFVSQSGALGLSVLDHAREYGIGISQFVSVGNKPDVSGNDLLEAWEHDPTVKVILMYVESFGNPRRFLEIASRVTKSKPVIVVKAGRSRAGALAASSHTGAMAASDNAVDAMLTQSGVQRAGTVEELFDLAMAFEARSLPKSRRTVVITNAGGPGIMAADALESCGLELVELAPATVEQLRPLFPPEASVRNPLDMIASATPQGYAAAMRAIMSDPGVDAVVPIFVPPFAVRQQDVATAIGSVVAEQPGKTVLAVLMGREGLPIGRDVLHASGVPAYIFPESAARALAALNRQREWASLPAAHHARLDADREAAAAIIARAQSEGRERLDELESLELLRTYGVPTADAGEASSETEAAEVAHRIGYPVAMKIMSPGINHKSDFGGVRVELANEEEVRAAYRDMSRRLRDPVANSACGRVLVECMVPRGLELIMGLTRDRDYGALLMFGLGGTLVEALNDVVFRVPPLDAPQALDMLTHIRAARLLDGVRGAPAIDRHALSDALRRIGQLGEEQPAILELDVNPVIAYEVGAVAVDARVRIAPAASRA